MVPLLDPRDRLLLVRMPVHDLEAVPRDRLLDVRAEFREGLEVLLWRRRGQDDEDGLPGPQALREELEAEQLLLIPAGALEDDARPFGEPTADDRVEAVDPRLDAQLRPPSRPRRRRGRSR